MNTSNTDESPYIALIPNVKLYGTYAGSGSNVNFGSLLFTNAEILFVLEGVFRSTSLLAGFGFPGSAMVVGAVSMLAECLKKTISKGNRAIPDPEQLKKKKSTIAVSTTDMTEINVTPLKQGWGGNVGIVDIRVVFKDNDTGIFKPGVRKKIEPLEIHFYPQLNKELKSSWKSQGLSKEDGIKDFAEDIKKVIKSMQS